MSHFVCKVHSSIPLQLICDDYVCGLCYEDILLKEKSRAKDYDVQLIAVPRTDGHRGVKIKAFRFGKEIT